MSQPPGNQARRQSKLRWESFNAFCDFGAVEAKLSPAAAWVWFVIFRHARDGVAAVSVGQVQESTGLCRATVLRAMKDMKTAGLIRMIERGCSAGRPSRYRIRPFVPQSRGVKP
jgi:hypothetical protein